MSAIEIISQSLKNSFPSEKLLLHSCCAPCSGSMIKVLVDLGIDVTILWYNPNIHPKEEYDIRKEENLKYAISLGIPFVDLDYDAREWFKRAKGLEYEPERGSRCTMCFDMRMERTALYASENGFKCFTTTNATSRWKDIEQVNTSGRNAAAHYPGITFWEFNWQTDEMTRLKYEVSASRQFYKQEYCGCLYSLRDTNIYRRNQGLDEVAIGKGGVFSDPIADAQEESQEVVDGFFQSANNQFDNERLRQLYSGRVKTTQGPGSAAAGGAASGMSVCALNNW